MTPTILKMATVTALFTGVPVWAGEKPLVMTRYTVTDVARNNNQPLGHLLIPQGWKAESKIEWTLASTLFPFNYWAKYSSPDGSAFLEVHPVFQGSYHSSQFGVQGNAGPKDVLEGLESIAKYVRPKAKFVVVSKKANEVAKDTLRPAQDVTVTTYHQTGTLTISYKDGDQEIVEEFAGSFYASQTDSRDGFSSRTWGMHGLRSIRATKAQFDRVRAIGVAMLRTARPTYEFLKAVEIASQCVRNIAQNDRNMRAIEQDMWLRTQKEINDTWRKTTDERLAVQDRQNEQLRDILGNVNRFVSGKGNDVLLPTTHQYAWEGPNGTYVLTNDAAYRPGADFTGQWEHLKPKR